MRVLWPLIALLALGGCSSAPSTAVPVPVEAPVPVNPPSHPLWAMKPRSWQEFKIYRGPGTFDPATGYIDFDMKNMVAGEINRNTNLVFQSAAGPAIARIYSPQGIVVDHVSDTLDAGLAERSTGQFIGESANYIQKDQDPPEPLLSLNPVVGEVIDTNSKITGWDGTTFYFVTRYRTHAVGVDFMGFKNCTITTLIEQPDKPSPTAYVQVFDGEMAAQWDGVVKADGTVDVIMGIRVASGDNP